MIGLLLSIRWAVRSLYAFLEAIDESSGSQGQKLASKRTPKRKGGDVQTAAAAPLPDDSLECDPQAWQMDGGGPRSTPLWLAFATLWLGFMANLVPYELIERSKFICE